MGTWGIELYSDDFALDLKDELKNAYSLYDLAKAQNKIMEIHKDLLEGNSEDDDYAIFWYVLADWQWEHGVLTDYVREKAENLLKCQAGMERFWEQNNYKDIEKRLNVLNKLSIKLGSKQPRMKIPKPITRKPKHKKGDIIVFRACEEKEDKYVGRWSIEQLLPSPMYRSEEIRNMGGGHDMVKLLCPFNAYNKYMAVLCVGTEKQASSEHFPELIDEWSIYAVYDYCSNEKPSVQLLRNCGFLPSIMSSVKPFSRETKSIEWCYLTSIFDNFRVNGFSPISEVFKMTCKEEYERFWKNLKKDYSMKVSYNSALTSVFFEFWEEKVRLSNIGISIDLLLKSDCKNPELLRPDEYDKIVANR